MAYASNLIFPQVLHHLYRRDRLLPDDIRGMLCKLQRELLHFGGLGLHPRSCRQMQKRHLLHDPVRSRV